MIVSIVSAGQMLLRAAVSPEPSDDMVKVFERPEFDQTPPWWSRAWTSVGRFFGSISFSWLGSGGKFLLGLALLGLVVIVAVRMWHRWHRRRRAKLETDGDIVPIEVGSSLDPTELRSQRAVAEEERDYTQAILLRYRELVVALMSARVVSSEPGRTTGELRLDVAAAVPSMSAAFDEGTAIFEITWYSDHLATEDDLNRLDRLAVETLAGLTSNSSAR